MTDSAVVKGASSDLTVFIAALTIAVMSLLSVVALVAGRFDLFGRHAEIVFWVELVAGGIILVAVTTVAPLALREMRDRHGLAASAIEARRQVEQLFRMTDMLQSALGYADANAVLQATAAQLLPGFGGALYVFNNSRDRLDLSAAWGWPGDRQPWDTVSPAQCWALKRGKPHLNAIGAHSLRCEHHGDDLAVLEIPMMARGEVYGLLNVQAEGDGAERRLEAVGVLAGAVADAMSLALSNIALREKLRTQALRDPLTGLYNRRYMEDVLERYANLSERNGRPLSAIMIDLDHFKRLNDQHGHAIGDAVLRETSAAIAGGIRPSDVACRYGGEEFVLLLPDCGLAEAAARAEALRGRVESLSEVHGMRVTASFGVATMPDTASKAGDLVARADAALYDAKRNGRNRVVSAARGGDVTIGSDLSAAAE